MAVRQPRAPLCDRDGYPPKCEGARAINATTDPKFLRFGKRAQNALDRRNDEIRARFEKKLQREQERHAEAMKKIDRDREAALAASRQQYRDDELRAFDKTARVYLLDKSAY